MTGGRTGNDCAKNAEGNVRQENGAGGEFRIPESESVQCDLRRAKRVRDWAEEDWG